MIGYSIIAGFILAILAPLGTSRMPLIERLAYWIGLCAAGGIGAGVIDSLAIRFNWTLKSWVRALGQSIGSTLCVVTALFILFPPYNLLSVALTFFYVWVIAIVICSIGILIRKAQSNEAGNKTDPQTSRPDILDRLPLKLRKSEIYAISAEDHYVRVHTSDGDHMILMRLTDAIKEASPLTGHKTHRSWWVAEAGVDNAKRKDGKIILTLKNGLTAPVSRSGQKPIKEAGWI
jgi:hypothetical protein